MSFPKLSHISAGITAVVVGYSSSVVMIIEAARAAGATPDMVMSWILSLSIGMGVTCIGFSIRYKVPVVTAWSTPGAAFLMGAVSDFELSDIIGAFILSAVLCIVAANSKAITNGIKAIPVAISSAMLAGILLPLCLGVFQQTSDYPILVFSFVALYLVGSVLFPRFLMLVLLIAALAASIFLSEPSLSDFDLSLPQLVWTTPTFSIDAFIGLAVPLFVITLLSQNLPGIAVLNSYGYKVKTGPVLTGLGLSNLIAAPFGGFAFNFAAITAAICMGEEAGSDKNQRYLAAVMAGITYLLFGIATGVVVVIFTLMPAAVISILAGLALLATFQASILKSLDAQNTRKAALLTFLFSASGITFIKLAAPVWGLVIGLLTVQLDKIKRGL
ncbi:benzoate/H(+) symporter BenE family transporter [Alteromonas sp. 5E99-2]|nr:benzoate/H(+) symporter BenE family transporter [Alteromonas sp. 5E99-2]